MSYHIVVFLQSLFICYSFSFFSSFLYLSVFFYQTFGAVHLFPKCVQTLPTFSIFGNLFSTSRRFSLSGVPLFPSATSPPGTSQFPSLLPSSGTNWFAGVRSCPRLFTRKSLNTLVSPWPMFWSLVVWHARGEEDPQDDIPSVSQFPGRHVPTSCFLPHSPTRPIHSPVRQGMEGGFVGSKVNELASDFKGIMLDGG